MLSIKVVSVFFHFLTFVSYSVVLRIIPATNADCPAIKPYWPPGLSNVTNRNLIIDWLLENDKKTCKDIEMDYSSYDGWYHNLAKIDLGSVEQPILRGWASIRIQESQARNWSETWNKIRSDSSMCKDTTNALALYFSKQIVDEILDTKDPSCFTTYCDHGPSNNPKEELNYASPYIDGEIIYGRSQYLLNKQIISDDGTINIDKLLALEMKTLKNNDLNSSSVLRIIWLRWHNYVAKRIRKICSEWPTEKIFNEARKFTIAVQQKIYAYEWLPFWTNKSLPRYLRYNPSVDPQVEKNFQAAMVIPQSIHDIECPFFSKKNRQSNNDMVNELITNLTVQPCKNVNEFKGNEYMQQNYGLPDINHARNVFKLSPYKTWQSFVTKYNPQKSILISRFTEEKLGRLDAMMGGTIESNNGPGELFVEVIHDQFSRIRDGDRFWFENIQNKLFSCEEVGKINQIAFADVILTVTTVNLEDIRNISAFVISKSGNLHEMDCIINPATDFAQLLKRLSVFKFRIYIVTFIIIVLIAIGIFGIAICLVFVKEIGKRKNIKKEYSVIRQTLQDDWQMHYPLFPVKEYIGPKEAPRSVVVILKKDKKQIIINSYSGTVLRVIDFNAVSKTIVKVLRISDEPTIVIQFPHNYDLVLKFESNYLREAFTTELDVFITNNNKLEKELIRNFNWRAAKAIIVTKSHRQRWLEMFFRVAFAQAFKIKHSMNEMLKVDAFVAKEVIYTELTIIEFADALSMPSGSEFVKRMFKLVDKDNNGFISFREFVDLIIIFAEGSTEKKAKLLFDLYDINGTGLVPAKEFLVLIKFFLETVGASVHNADIQETITAMMQSAGMVHKNNLDFNDFINIIGNDIKELANAKLGFMIDEQGKADTYLTLAKQTFEAMYRSRNDVSQRFQGQNHAIDEKQDKIIQPPVQHTRLFNILLFLELNSKQVFCMVLLTLLIIFVFVERVYAFASENRLNEINRFCFGVIYAAKYGLVLSYAVLFVTMCKNIWTYLEDMFSKKIFSLDYLVRIHIVFGYLSAIFTGIHVIGEILIYYAIISTSDTTACQLKKYLINQDTFSIHMMFWQNSVVITGFLLILIFFIIFVFAQPCIRQKLQHLFNVTHNLYPLLIVIIMVHSSQCQTSLIYWIMMGPLIFFFLDLFISLNRKKIELPVLRVEFFPSHVICLILRRPENFQYKVGQWVRLAVPSISRREFYPFTISSAPHEPYLRIYLRLNNPWAHQVNSLFDGPGSGYAAAPVRVLLHGPYGSGAQHWRLYDVVVLVGGGTGVASFAAVLKDVSHALQAQEYLHCQKVYFIWVAKSQKHFEWMVDLIREIEDNDPKFYISCHIFITQFYEKFDLRTVMLYICEKHYQRISGKSLFTNLRAVTHFGRPAISDFLKTVQSLHDTAKHIGVFSSGPISLYRAVNEACRKLNLEGNQRFEHHADNF